MGAWLASNSCEVIGGKCGNIGGVTDEKYAIGIQCDAGAPVVRGVRFDEMYPQAGYVGSGAGEGLPVNFAATCVGGLMEACVAINTRAVVNTYGVFRGFWGEVTKSKQSVPQFLAGRYACLVGFAGNYWKSVYDR